MDEHDLIDRWIGILRAKAGTYESPERLKGGEPASPDLHDICNEMEAYLAGLGENPVHSRMYVSTKK